MKPANPIILKSLIRKFWFLFLVLVIEGASLMAVELMGAKLLAPFYGSSLYVWTAVLGITVLGLSMGYFFGGKLSVKKSSEKLLMLILGTAALLVFTMPATAKVVISLTSSMALIPGICIASFFLLVPPMFCFGLVGPMVVRLMTNQLETIGTVTGVTYFTSTLGGVLATFLIGYVLIPESGLKFSTLVTTMALASLPVVYWIKTTISPKKKEITADESISVQRENPVLSVKSKKKSPEAKSIKNSFYLLAALEGGTVMAVELLAARMLAPFFGGSLYVWVAVIGITLVSLALGYYAGGRVAGKQTNIRTIYWVLLIASGFLMLMPFLSEHLTIGMMEMDVRIAAVLVGLIFVLPPLLFLGMVPTLLVSYLATKIDEAGSTAGNVFTISSASGILALPIMGFFVIPNFGLAGPAIVIGLLVGIFPLVKLLSQKKYLSLSLVVIFFFSMAQRTTPNSSPDIKVLSFSEGLLGQVLVADVLKDAAGNRTNDRTLFINRMGQTHVDRNSFISKWNYVIFASSIASKLPENSRALVLGLGGGSIANNLAHLNYRVDAVELDQRIADIARNYFALDPNVKVIIDDARHYVETTKQTYDLIFFDVFNGDVQPPHVISLECFSKAKTLLNKNGLMIVNFHGFLNGDLGKPGRSVYATLLAAGLNTKIFPTPGNEDQRNSLFIASIEPQEFHQVRSPLLHSGKPVDIESLFLGPNTINMNDAIVFTDDKPILDRLNMKANNIWRKSYNGSYARFFHQNGIPLFN